MADNITEKELSKSFDECKDQNTFFKLAIGTLLIFLKEFSLDLQEINADAFKKDIDRLNEKILSERKVTKITSDFDKSKKTILSYIDRLKRYVNDREKEFKGIIDLLIKAMANLDRDNQVFNKKIYTQTEKIEKITFLDDIRKIKNVLEIEIEQIRETVNEKQNLDRDHLSQLSQKVDDLNVALEKAKSESMTDGLTGAYNRMAFDDRIKSLVERNSIAGTPFSLLLMDIDNFKEINDQYGHPIGDRVLLALVQKCNDVTRNDDFVARFGGDEFAVILLGASIRNATKKAKQLCKIVSETCYAVNCDETSEELSFSISIGVGAFNKGDTVESVTARADKALYAAKHQGKSRVFTEKELR